MNIKTYKIETHDVDLPEDYACECKYCKEYKGMLIRQNGELYNKNERRQYYHYERKGGAGHINPTPLHIARWAIQTFTKERETVLDPFAGTGTTIVEAINNGRNGIGYEIDTIEVAKGNIKSNMEEIEDKHIIGAIIPTDARNISKIANAFEDQYSLSYSKVLEPIALTILHPPYSGDEQANAKYDPSVDRNLAFLKESKEYWDTMRQIINDIYYLTKDNGYIVIGIKEMMRNKKWWDLHIKYGNLLSESFTFKGMYLLPHYPRTLHLNTYFTRYGVHPSYYQTILVFQCDWGQA